MTSRYRDLQERLKSHKKVNPVSQVKQNPREREEKDEHPCHPSSGQSLSLVLSVMPSPTKPRQSNERVESSERDKPYRGRWQRDVLRGPLQCKIPIQLSLPRRETGSGVPATILRVLSMTLWW